MEEQKTQQYTPHIKNLKFNIINNIHSNKISSSILYINNNKIKHKHIEIEDIPKNTQDNLNCYNHNDNNNKHCECSSLKLSVLSPKINHHPEIEYETTSPVIEKYPIARNSKIIWPIFKPIPKKDFVKKREVNKRLPLNNNNTFKGNQNYSCEYTEYSCCQNNIKFDRKLSTLSSSLSTAANAKAAATASSTATTTTQTKSKENSSNDLITETAASSSRVRNSNNDNNYNNNKNIRNLNHNKQNHNNNQNHNSQNHNNNHNHNNHNNNNNNNQNHSGKSNNKKKNSWKNRYANRNYESSKSQNQQQQQPNYQEQPTLFQSARENEPISLNNSNTKTNHNHNHKNKNNSYKEKGTNTTNQSLGGNNKHAQETRGLTSTGNNNNNNALLTTTSTTAASITTTTTSTNVVITTTTPTAEISYNLDKKINKQSSAATKSNLNVAKVDSTTLVLPALVLAVEPEGIPQKAIISENINVEPISTIIKTAASAAPNLRSTTATSSATITPALPPPPPKTTTVDTTDIKQTLIKTAISKSEHVATSNLFSDIVHQNTSEDKFTVPNSNPLSSTYTLDFLHSVGVQITGSTTMPRMRALPFATYGMDINYDTMFNTQIPRGNSYSNYVNYNTTSNIENYSNISSGGGAPVNNNYRKFFRELPTGMPNYAHHISGNNQQRHPYHQYQHISYHQQSSLPTSSSTLSQKDVLNNNNNNNNNNSNFGNVVNINVLNDERQNELPALVDSNTVKNQNYEMMQQHQNLHGRINHSNTNLYQQAHVSQCKQQQQQQSQHHTATPPTKHSQNSQANAYRNLGCYDNNGYETYINGNGNNGIAVGENRNVNSTATGVQRNLTQNRNNALPAQVHYHQNTPIHQQNERLGGGKSNGSNSSIASTISQTSAASSFRKAQQQQQRQSQQFTRQSHQYNNNNNNNAIYNNSRSNFHQQQNITSHHHHQQQQPQQQISNQNFSNLTYVNTRNDTLCGVLSTAESQKKLKSETVPNVNIKLNTITAIPLPIMQSKDFSKKDKKDAKNCMMNKALTSYDMMQDSTGKFHYQQLNNNNNGAIMPINDNNKNNNKMIRSSSISSAKVEPLCLTTQNAAKKNILKKYENENFNNRGNINNNNINIITSNTLDQHEINNQNNNNNNNHQCCQTEELSESQIMLLPNSNIQLRSPALGLSSGASSTASISPRCDENQCMHLSSQSSSSSCSSIAEDNILKHTMFRGRSKRMNHHNNNIDETTSGSGKKSQHTQTFQAELQHIIYLRSLSTNSITSHDMFAHTPPDRFLARAHLIEVKKPPVDLLNNSKWDNLSQEIWNKFISSQQTEGTFKQKMRLWRDLYILIKNKYPRYGLYLVGSTISGFGADSSDVDMCLVSRTSSFVDPRTEALLNLNTLRDCLIMSGDFECFNLIEAKVPILRFRDCHNKLEVDLNYNNSVGIKNTHLLYCYSQLDWRLRPLVLVVKLWAQYHNINNAKNMTISSYSLVLMVIHFLQYAVSPPVLPCLHALFPDKFAMWRLNEVGHVDMNESMIGAFESKNTQTLGELFLCFLEYYSRFNYGQSAISIRTGGLLPIQTCRLAKSIKNDAHQWKELCIEEPFDLTNTARSVYDFETFERVKTVFITSWRILNNSFNLNDIFSPNALPPIISLNDNERNMVCTGIVDGIDDDIMTNVNSQRNEETSKPNSPIGSQTDIKFDPEIITSVIEPSGSVVNIIRWDSNNNHTKNNNAIEKTNTIKTNINYKNPIT